MNALRPRLETWLFAAAALHALVLAPWRTPTPFPSFAGQAQTTLFVQLPVERVNAPDRNEKALQMPGQEEKRRPRPATPPQTVTAKVSGEPADSPDHGSKETLPRESVSSEAIQKDVSVPTHDMKEQQAATKHAEIEARLRTDLARYFEYPVIAQRRGWEGQVVLRFMVAPEGRLEQIQIAKTSGYDVLDQAARRALERVERLQDTAGALGGHVEMELPVIYRLQEH